MGTERRASGERSAAEPAALSREPIVTLPSALRDALAIAGGSTAASLAVLLATQATPTLQPMLAAACLALASGVAAIAPRRAAREAVRPARDGDAIVIGSRARIPIAHVQAVDVYAPREDADAGVRMRWLDPHDCVLAELDVASHDDAELLLRELGLDGARPARELALLPQPFAFSADAHRGIAVLVGAALGLACASASTYFVPFGLALGIAFVDVALAGRIRVGDDGFELRPSLVGRRRFVPFGQIASIERDRGTVAVRLGNGERIVIPMADALNGRWARARADAIVNAIRHRMARRRAAGESDAIVARLARGERDEASWRASLRELARSAGYRGAAVSDEALAALVTDGDVDPSVREGAAIVLHERGIGRERLREIASRNAHPRVRVVVEEIAKEEEKGERRGRMGR